MINIMDMVSIIMEMVPCIKETGSKIYKMDRDSNFSLINLVIQVNLN